MSTKVQDSHLSSPIRSDNRRLFLCESDIPVPTHIRLCRSSCPVKLALIRADSERIYGELLSLVYTIKIPLKWTLNRLDDYYTAANEVVKTILEHQHISHHYPVITDTVRCWYSAKIIWEDIRMCMQYAADPYKYQKAKTALQPEYVMYYNKHYLVLSPTPDEWWLLDYEQVMMVSDTISARALVLVYNYLMVNSTTISLTSEFLISVYKLVDTNFRECGNILYNQIKMIEPIIIAVLLEKFDDQPLRGKFLEELIKVAHAENMHMILRFRELLTNVNSVNDLAELHGMYRHWGHPTVDEVAGCNKVRRIGQEIKTLDQASLRDMEALMKRQFCTAFIKRHHRWPNILLTTALKSVPLGRVIEANNTNINLYSTEFELKTWQYIRFGKEFQFDMRADFTSMIDDKSICLPREFVAASYNRALLLRTIPPCAESRRVLVESLRRCELNISQIIEIVNNDEVPLSWLVVGLHSKEREHKIEPRLFAMMVIEMRLFFCVTEYNIKEYIFPYFPQQTMDSSDRELQHRLISFSSVGDKIYAAMFAGIDFSNWNIHWRYESTEGVFKMVDHLFGYTRLVSYTHVFFASSLMILLSHLHPPETLTKADVDLNYPEPCDTLWYNHLGGIEGLRQKGWTLTTIGLLLLVEHRSGIKTKLIGNADNQIAKLLMILGHGCKDPELYIKMHPEEFSLRLNNYLVILESTAKDLGMKVKIDETWISRLFISYGKEMLYKSMYLSQTYKKFSRAIPDVNDVWPSIYMKVATLMASIISTFQKGYDLVFAYVLALVEVFALISRDIKFKPYLKQYTKRYTSYEVKQEFLILMSVLTSDIGRLPLTPYLSCLYRGHPDPLTTQITTICAVANKHAIVRQFLELLMSGRIIDKRGNPEVLVLNPCAVNIEGPTGPGTYYKRLTQKLVSETMRNNHIRELLNSTNDIVDNQLYEFLLSTVPLAPRCLHEYYIQTPTATVNEFLSKFSNSRTFLALLRASSSSPDIGRAMEKGECELIEYWLGLYDKSRSTLPTDNAVHLQCPTILAQHLRDTSWAQLVGNKPICGVTVPHPFHQFDYIWQHEPVVSVTTEYAVFVCTTTDSHRIITTPGPYDPYLGSETREKMSGRVFQVPNCGRPLRSAERLLQLSEWFASPNSTLQGFAHDLIKLKTDTPYDMLRALSRPITGGSVIHRLNDHVTKRGSGNNFRSTITSNVYFSSDHLGRFSRGNENYNIHYQGIIHAGLALITYHAGRYDNLPGAFMYAVHNCNDCVEKVPDTCIHTDASYPKFTPRPTNPLLFTPAPEIEEKLAYCHKLFITPYKESSADAAAHVILARIVNTTGVFILGTEPYNHRHAASLPLHSISSIGLKPIMDSLCRLIYLLWGMTPFRFNMFWRALKPEVYQDLIDAILLPENLHTLLAEDQTEALPDLFLINGGAYRLFRQQLVSLYTSICDTKPLSVVFYIFEDITPYKVIKMWVKSLNHNRNLKSSPRLTREIIEIMTRSESIHAASITNLITRLRKEWGISTVLSVLKTSRPVLSKRDPTHVVEAARTTEVQYIRSTLPKFSASLLPVVPYMRELQLPDLLLSPTGTIEEFSLQPTRVVSFERQLKTRQDHQYRLYGVITTAYLKYIQLVRSIPHKINTCICLAEGEGGVARLLVQLGCKVFFNTMVNRHRLIPHRAVGYVPAACVLLNDALTGGTISALGGGDINEDQVQESILRASPTHIDLITCDAESANWSPKERIHLVSAVMRIASGKQIPALVLKTYLTESSLLMTELALVATVYNTIKIVVPLFSSHESTECFIVAKHTRSECLYTQNQVYVITNQPGLVHQLDMMRMERILPVPHQSLDKVNTRRIVEVGKFLKFDDNLIHSIRVLLLGSIDLPHTTKSVAALIPTIEKKIQNGIDEICRGFVHQYTGGAGHPFGLYEMTRPHTIHKELEYWSLATLNAGILGVLVNESRESELNDHLQGFVDQPVTLPGSPLPKFVFTITWKEWSSRFSKVAWRIWGHVHDPLDLKL